MSEQPSASGQPSANGQPPEPAERGALAGPDGNLRCPWGLSAPDYLAYHDEEWGRPVRGDTAIFERLCLEGFQSGLSWLTILRKRENFRAAFAGFDPQAVAAFGDQDVARLMADAGIVRNRSKVNAVIANARAALGLPDGLSALVWKYEAEAGPAPRTLAEVPASTPARHRRMFHLVCPSQPPSRYTNQLGPGERPRPDRPPDAARLSRRPCTATR